MKNQITFLFFLLLLFLLVPTSQALFGFDEFLDDDPQLIRETIENELGGTCSDCNTTMLITYPNGTEYGFFTLSFNASSNTYDKQLNLTLVNENTTIYGISLTANRTSTKIFNGTSDRTQITIYDIFPVVDSMWDVGLVLIFIIIQWFFMLMAYRFHEEHVVVKYLFYAIALALNAFLLGIGQRILVINGVTQTKFINMVDSAEVIGIILIWIFTAYIMLYLIYHLTQNVLREGGNLSRRISKKR